MTRRRGIPAAACAPFLGFGASQLWQHEFTGWLLFGAGVLIMIIADLTRG